MFIRSGIERSGPQTTNDFDAEVGETAHGVDGQKDDTVKGIYGTQEGVSDGAMDVEDVRHVVQDIGTRVIDGAQVIPN